MIAKIVSHADNVFTMEIPEGTMIALTKLLGELSLDKQEELGLTIDEAKTNQALYYIIVGETERITP